MISACGGELKVPRSLLRGGSMKKAKRKKTNDE